MIHSDWYTRRAEEAEHELHEVKQKIFRISMLRLLFFVAGVAGVVCLFHADRWMLLTAIAITFVPFLLLVKLHSRLYARKEWIETRIEISRNELKGLEGDFSAFDGGSEYIDPQHLYSYDIDVFGEKSVFQMLNRTCTRIGKDLLARQLQHHLTQKSDIERRQDGIREMSERAEFRETFRITGTVFKGESTDEQDIRAWIDSTPTVANALWARLLVVGVPAINAVLLIGGALGIISSSWFVASFVFFLVLSLAFVGKATRTQESFGRKLKTLNCYARLIALTRKEQWQSEEIKDLLNRLDIDGQSPVKALNQLTKELDRLDLRNNQLLYSILEGTMFFQLRQIVRIERWKIKYGRYAMDWLRAAGELDALCSLSTFAYNHPAYTYPQITDEPFCFEAKEMGHPLMAENKCVKNDVHIPIRPYFLIITGANMAGKSTYLRTIGVNYLLACIGCPVCCRSLTLYPAQLVTSLRTSDSLAGNESYFFAEMKRLKRIIDLLNEGNELFIILDEILKGTNSTDKQKGSFDLIKQFVRLRANGIIATHDLLLGTLAEQFPNEISNYCFEADIENDELTFSYRLREGIAQNMNACFIMRKMGITIE